MGNIPTVSIQIDGMRRAIIASLQAHHQAIEDSVAATLAEIIEGLDFRELVKSQAPAIIKQAVEEEIKWACKRIFDDQQLRAKLAEVVRGGMLHKYAWEKAREDKEASDAM